MKTLTSENPRTMPRWPVVVVCIFAIAVVAGLVYLGASVHRSLDAVEIPERWELSDIVRVLNNAGMDLHPISQRLDGDWESEGTVYLCEDHTKNRLDIIYLRVDDQDNINKWNGVVMVKRRFSFGLINTSDIQENWLITDRFEFFGDKRLIQRLRLLLSSNLNSKNHRTDTATTNCIAGKCKQ